MAENKKSFIAYADWLAMVEKLPDDMAGQLFKLILEYVNDKNPENPSHLVLQVAFEPIKLQLKRDLKKWDSFKIKQSENGKLGGRPRKNKPGNPSLISESQKSLNVNVNVTDIHKKEFDVFRVKYPGTKRGNETEFKNFLKHKDWADILPTLSGIIDRQIAAREAKVTSGAFTPEWKNLQTWINQRCWEEVISEPATKKIYAYDNRPSN